jgi:hypothetical protein
MSKAIENEIKKALRIILRLFRKRGDDNEETSSRDNR